MPLTVNVGLTKKLGETNYGSRGASVNLELELDGSLTLEPAKLHEKIRQLFGLVRTSLHEELNSNGAGNGHAEASANGNGTSHQAPASANGRPRPATTSQVKALHAIAKNHRLELGAAVRARYNVGRPEELSIRQASELIDALKAGDGGKA